MKSLRYNGRVVMEIATRENDYIPRLRNGQVIQVSEGTAKELLNMNATAGNRALVHVAKKVTVKLPNGRVHETTHPHQELWTDVTEGEEVMEGPSPIDSLLLRTSAVTGVSIEDLKALTRTSGARKVKRSRRVSSSESAEEEQ